MPEWAPPEIDGIDERPPPRVVAAAAVGVPASAGPRVSGELARALRPPEGGTPTRVVLPGYLGAALHRKGWLPDRDALDLKENKVGKLAPSF